MVCLQKLTPFLIEQSSICLKIVLNFLVWLGVLFLQRNNFLKEFKPNKVGSPPCQEKTTSGPVTGQYISLCVWDLNSLTNACNNLTLTHQWQQVQVTTTMPSAATDLRTQVYLYGEGNMDFDGAVLTQDLLSDGGFQGGGYGWQAISLPGGVTNHVVYEDASLAREGTHYMEANTSPNAGSIFQDTSVNLPAEASA